MENESKRILDIIKKDDIKEFDRLIFKKKNLRLGRFPLLSIAYLYGSQGIYSRFQGKLLSPEFTNYNSILEEPVALYDDFKKVAGKCLRFYLEDVVEPVEMLAIMGKSELLQKIWIYAPKTQRTLQNIKNIYSIIHNESIEISEDAITLPKIKGSKDQFKGYIYAGFIHLAIVLSCLAIVFVYLVSFGVGTTVFPYKSTNNFFNISNNGVASIDKDLTLSKDYKPTDSSATIVGNNNVITIEKLPLINSFSGKLSDLTIVIKLSETDITGDSAVIMENNGVLENVKVVFGGSFVEDSDIDNLYLSALVHENNGTINNCSAFLNISFKGNGDGNAYFSSISSINNGDIIGCSLEENSRILADTVDICGISAVNNKLIENCSSNGYLYQFSNKSFEIVQDGETTVYSWNPNVAGICLNNNSDIKGCSNFANIEIKSEATSSHSNILGGIVCSNLGNVLNCKNTGELVLNTDNYNAYVGGIVAINDRKEGDYGNYILSSVSECSQNGEISVKAGKYIAFAGGIVGENLGAVSGCKGYTSFTLEGEQTFAGGILGADLINSSLNNIYYNYYTNHNSYVKSETAPQPYPIILVESTTTDSYGNKKTTITPYLSEDKTFTDSANNVFYGNYNFAYDNIDDLIKAEGDM